MEILLFIGLPMIIASCITEKYKKLAIGIAQQECNKRFKHYYKYEL